jgi:hypothetical protein
MNPCFLLGNPERTNTTGRRRSRWCCSSTTRRSLVTPVRPLKAVLRVRMRRCVWQAPAQPSLGHGPERLHRAVHLQTGGPHDRPQRWRLSGCSRHHIRRRRCHAVQLIIHLKLNLPRKSLLVGHEFLCVGTTTIADVV